MSLVVDYLKSIFLSPHVSFAERPWAQYTIRVAPYTINLQLPTGVSRDFPGQKALEQGDPEGPYDGIGWQVLLEMFWDDPQVRSSLVAGTARFAVALCRIPPEAPEAVTLLDGLAHFLDRSLREAIEKYNQEAAEEATQFTPMQPPERYEPFVIAGRQWLAFKWPTEPKVSAYAMPLSSSAYLRLQFSRISTGPRPEWEADVIALRDEILARVRLEG